MFQLSSRLASLAALAMLASCTNQLVESPRDPFVTYLEQFGQTASSADSGTSGGTSGSESTLSSPTFRRELTVTLNNTHPTANLETYFIAWVALGSVQNGDQQDTLLASGYVQLTRTLQIGPVYTLPPGTFVFNGRRTTTAARVRLAPAGSSTNASPTLELTMPTPDVVLVYSAPPASCDSTAFTFDVNGVIDTSPSTGTGGYKTLAQIDVYQCDPLRPGLFYQAQGGDRADNQFREGSPITFTFSETATADGAFATVTIGS